MEFLLKHVQYDGAFLNLEGLQLIDIINVLSDLEEMDELHMARILLLLRAFGGKKGREPFDGLTKLAKLDFLLRYPCYLERALKSIIKDSTFKIARNYERTSIESQMMRYHYGPWDPRHRKTLNLLIAKGLAEAVEGRPTYIKLTQKGVEISNILRTRESFEDTVNRAKLLSKHFNWTGTKLKKFIYNAFPEIVSLKHGEFIGYEF